MGWRKQFKGRQFADEVILWAVRWYLMFPISYRDLELMLLDRGVEVDHTTIFRWIQAYAVLSWRSGSGRICGRATARGGGDETYVRVKGRWTYLYRAVDSCGQTIDFLLGEARCWGGEAVLPQGAGPATHGEPTHCHRRQESRLSEGHR